MECKTLFITEFPLVNVREKEENIVKDQIMVNIFNSYLKKLSSLNDEYVYTLDSCAVETAEQEKFPISMYSSAIKEELNNFISFCESQTKNSEINCSNNKEIKIKYSNKFENVRYDVKKNIVLGKANFNFANNRGLYVKIMNTDVCELIYNDYSKKIKLKQKQDGYYSQTTFAFFNNGNIYNVINGKHLPCTLKQACNAFSRNYLAYLFLETYLEYFSYPLYKDIVHNISNYLKECDNNLIKALQTINTSYTFNEIQKYHSIQDMIQSHYKTCKNVPRSVNKMYIGQATNRALACRYVSENEMQKIYQVPYNYNCIVESPITVIINFYKIHVKGIEKVDRILVNDYIYMCKKVAQPCNLHISSANKMLTAHNEIMIKYNEKLTSKYNRKKLVLKNIKGKPNPFYNLQLPDGFVIINSDKRLKEEGKIMHNCVSSYRDFILAGKCLIAHLYYNNEHCTVEINCKKKGKKNSYFCAQIYRECNQEVSIETKKYVNSVLKELNNT